MGNCQVQNSEVAVQQFSKVLSSACPDPLFFFLPIDKIFPPPSEFECDQSSLCNCRFFAPFNTLVSYFQLHPLHNVHCVSLHPGIQGAILFRELEEPHVRVI